MSQLGQAATFHVDHIIPVSSDGQTVSENPALACVGCSLHKSARSMVLDSVTGELVPIFHPRQDNWHTHFRWEGVLVVGLTPIGRATLDALKMNRPIMRSIREEERFWGRHPHII